jgi:hypothetical protein
MVVIHKQAGDADVVDLRTWFPTMFLRQPGPIAPTL